MSRAREVGDLGSVTTVSNGNVGIGTSSPQTLLDIQESGSPTSRSTFEMARISGADATANDLTLLGPNTSQIRINFGDPESAQAGDIAYNHASNNMRFTTNGTERMRIDSSGNVGIGEASPDAKLDVVGAADAKAFSVNTPQGRGIDLTLGNSVGSTGPTLVSNTSAGLTFGVNSGGPLRFNTSSTERARIDASGNLLVGTTTSIYNVSGAGSGFEVNGAGYISTKRNTTASATQVAFHNPNGLVGQILTSSTSTSYVTSSDYRLKENVVPLDDAADRLAQIPVHRFNFIVDPDTTVDGFLAHEVQAIVPEAVTGTKDAMREEEYVITPVVEATYDEEGNVLTEAVPAVMGTRTVPDYQGIDQSKLVPLLTAALQEALQKIDALEARIATLEGGA